MGKGRRKCDRTTPLPVTATACHQTVPRAAWIQSPHGGRRTEKIMACANEDHGIDILTEGRCPWCGETNEPDTEPDCEHGLSAWLCAGPMHYPV